MIYNNEYFLFVDPNKDTFSNTNQIELGPDIKRHSPIIVNTEEGYLREVNFYNESGNKKLEYTEELEVKKDGSFYTTYSDIDIIAVNNLTKDEPVDFNHIEDNKFMTINSDVDDVIKIEYILNNSFIINKHYNYSLKLDKEYSDIDVIYETDLYTPYYTINDKTLPNGKQQVFNFNPHYNDYMYSFLFITDKEYPVENIDILIDIDYIQPRYDKYIQKYIMPIKAKIVDQFNNPVYTTGNISATHGNIEIDDNRTDIYGNLYGRYIPPLSDINQDTITIQSEGIQKSFDININSIMPSNNLQITFPNHPEGYINSDECIVLRVSLLDHNLQPISNESVNIEIISDDTTVHETAFTNSNGVDDICFCPETTTEKSYTIKVTHGNQVSYREFTVI